MNNRKKAILAAAIFVLLAAVLLLVRYAAAPETADGQKNIVLEVVHRDESRKEYAITTGAENLRGALEGEGLIAGTEGPYGLYVLTVDGETADESAQEWWCFKRGGEMLNTGVDETMIADGEHYEAVLTTGW